MMKFEYKISQQNVTQRCNNQVKREQMESMNELRKLAGLEEAKPTLDLDGDGDKKSPTKSPKDKKEKRRRQN